MLLPLWPVCCLYVANAAEAPWPELVRPALVVSAVAAGCYLLGRLALRDRHKAGVACVGLWLWVLGWGHLEHVLGRWPALLQQYLFTIGLLWVLALAIPLAAVVLTRRALAPLSTRLNALAVVVAAWQAVSVGSCAWRGPAQPPELPPPPAAAPAATSAAGLPSIYYIVLDSYGRQDVLAYLYGYDNEPFRRFLESRGFYVARQARSNYCHTWLSQTSTLACQHLRDSRQGGRGQPVLADNAVLVEHYLQRRGYRLALRSYDHSSGRQTRQGERSRWALSNFEQKLLAMTMLRAVSRPPTGRQPAGGRSPAQPFAMKVGRLGQDGAWATLPLLRGLGDEVGGRRPLFLRVHLLCPHPPFIFPPTAENKARYLLNQESEDGDRRGGSLGGYRRAYRDQLAYLNGLLMPAIDRLLAKAGPNSIIILQGDHGPASRVRWEHPEQTLMKERLGILLAIRLPPGPRPALRQDMTPVNLFPVLFRQYLGYELPARPDDSYFSRFTHPREFIQVTEAARAAGWRLGYPGHWGAEVPPARARPARAG